MPVTFADRVMMTVAAAPGTAATVALGSPVVGYTTFQGNFSDGATLDYVILDGNNWECGVGTYHAGPNTITRAGTPDASSNGGASINASNNSIIANSMLASLMNYLLSGQTRMASFSSGIPSASEIIFAFTAAGNVGFLANFGGSRAASASATATASTTFTVKKNGSSIGTIVWGVGAATATFTTSGGAAQNMVAGDVLTIVGPVSPDATLADIAITLNAFFTS